MNLPEIRHYTSLFLGRKDLLSCITVSRDWYASILPCLYTNLFTSPDDSVWASPTFKSNLQHVRDLTIYSSVSQQKISSIMEGCTGLADLWINISELDIDLAKLFITALCHQNPRLGRVRVRYHPPGGVREAPKLLCSPIQIFGSRLTELRLKEVNLKYLDSMDRVLDLAATQLKILHIVTCVLSQPKRPWSTWPVFPYLQELEIQACEGRHMTWEDQVLNLFARCPELESLTWDIAHPIRGPGDMIPAMTTFADLVQTATWPKLSSLAIVQTGHYLERYAMISDGQLAPLIHFNCSILKSIKMPLSAFATQSWSSMIRHFGALERLDLSRCPEFNSGMCQEVLMSCPQLRELSAVNLKVIHMASLIPCSISASSSTATTMMVRGRPWVCSRLESLTLTLICPKVTNNNSLAVQQQLAYVVNQLAKMKHLKCLVLNCLDRNSGYNRQNEKPYGLDPSILPGMNFGWDFSDLKSPTFTRVQMTSHPYGQRLLEIWPQLQYCVLN